MAAVCIVAGVQREIYRESVLQAGTVLVPTHIRISQGLLSRVRGLLVITSVVGVPVVTASPVVVGGFLNVLVANTAGGTSFTWDLDVMLTESSQQANDTHAGIISVVTGTLGAAVPLSQNLAQTYNFGAAAANQTMVIDNVAKGGGIIIDANTSVTAPLYPLEIRESLTQATYGLAIVRRGNDVTGPSLEFNKARGAYGAPADDQATDLLGTVRFVGRVNAISSLCAYINAPVLSIGAGPTITTGIDFGSMHASVLTHTWRMDASADGGVLIGYGIGGTPNPVIEPDTNHTGSLGIVGAIWAFANVDTANVYANVCFGGGAVGGGAVRTVMFPNTSTMPAIQANQIYVGSVDFQGDSGSTLACLAITSEEPAVVVGPAEATNLIPIMFNGQAFYLLAYLDEQQV